MSIIDKFPLETPRKSQVQVLDAIEKAFKDGYRNVLLEAPVGSGKSAIAVACAKHYGATHILTPRKSLQNQYWSDFHKESLVTMKGRNAYPCTADKDDPVFYDEVVDTIERGKIILVPAGRNTCAEGPCITSVEAKRVCVDGYYNENNEYCERFPCPYNVAIDVAQKNAIIVHNLHSFIFQTYYAGRFIKRSLLVIDECHEIEGIIRDFMKKNVSIPLLIEDEDLPVIDDFKMLEEWTGYFAQFADKFADEKLEQFETLMEDLVNLSSVVEDKYTVEIEKDERKKRTSFIFTPMSIGNMAKNYLYNFGEKVLLMSGTVYNKDQYCRLNGLRPEETCFIRIGSSFPVGNRPIYLKEKYTVDTSHAHWDSNFKQLVTNIKTIMEAFPDKKGLIHSPSYYAGLALYNALRDTGRIMTHDKDNFQTKLTEFYKTDKPMVFMSPICQQGVDFKGDKATFQMILRVPYPSTADAFMSKKVKEDFPYYNYQALIVFGQMIGRINRSEDDFGVTVLMDERFRKFITRNKSILPKWLTDAVIYN